MSRTPPHPSRPPDDLECWEINGGAYRVFVFTLPDETQADPLCGLTDAERKVVVLAMSGLSDKAIAEQRGTALRTVINQLRSACRKLGVSGRVELAQKVSGRTIESATPPKK